MLLITIKQDPDAHYRSIGISYEKFIYIVQFSVSVKASKLKNTPFIVVYIIQVMQLE